MTREQLIAGVKRFCAANSVTMQQIDKFLDDYAVDLDQYDEDAFVQCLENAYEYYLEMQCNVSEKHIDFGKYV